MSPEEKREIRDVLNSDRFCDSAPRDVYAASLDEGRYYCHWRTMYRILNEHNETGERRRQRRRTTGSKKPKLRAQAPNQVWSWDITLLRGPGKQFYHLYTIIDIYSRYVTGWMIAPRESGQLAEALIAATCEKQEIAKDQLILHSDHGSAMKSNTVTDLLQDLGITKSRSRQYTPTDNPYSESQFKTLKYRPDYPKRFTDLQEAHDWARAFFTWYNQAHYHSGLALLTSETVHYGQAEQIQNQRQRVLDEAYAAHPERFVGGPPTVGELPKEVWINQPEQEQEDEDVSAEPTGSDLSPGTQAASRASSEAPLDADEHLAIVEQPLGSAEETGVFYSEFELELCQTP